MGSEDCHNETLRNARNRHYHCSSKYVVEDDIVSQKYLDAFARLGASVRVIDEIPNSKYTTLIPGGRATFWGMSFNKLRIFDMVEFRKILFIDADVLLLKNIDHIMLEPDFTAAFTTECCNGGARGKLGGGMWVFEPSHARWNYTMEMIQSPCPDADFGVRGCCGMALGAPPALSLSTFHTLPRTHAHLPR
jgi:alpha-N-acetylglucosamine transferase